MGVLTAQIANPGGRGYNEDAFLEANTGKAYCCVLADGLGGHGGGDVAASAACEAAIESFRANDQLSAAALMAHFRAAEAAVRRRHAQAGNQFRMRTTLVIVLVNDTHVIWGHIGDSRLYHLRAGRLAAQTKDHSVPQAMADAGDIRPEQIRHHEDRNRLLRVIGADDESRPAVMPAPVPINRGDAFLLCTDGFWEYVHELEFELDYAKSREPAEWLRYMELRLQQRVDGTNDNYTAIAIFVDSARAPMPARLSTRKAAPEGPADRKLAGALTALAVILGVAILVIAVAMWAPRLNNRQATAADVSGIRAEVNQ